jgi:hypothetical protein
MHEIAVNVIVRYKASASVVFLCLFIMINGLNTLCGFFILYQLRKARGCFMHVFSSNYVVYNVEGVKMSKMISIR